MPIIWKYLFLFWTKRADLGTCYELDLPSVNLLQWWPIKKKPEVEKNIQPGHPDRNMMDIIVTTESICLYVFIKSRVAFCEK